MGANEVWGAHSDGIPGICQKVGAFALEEGSKDAALHLALEPGAYTAKVTDLEGTGASAQPGGADDPMIAIEGLRDTGRQYAADDLRHPLAAPLHGDFAGLPPLLIQVGTREVLLECGYGDAEIEALAAAGAVHLGR